MTILHLSKLKSNEHPTCLLETEEKLWKVNKLLCIANIERIKWLEPLANFYFYYQIARKLLYHSFKVLSFVYAVKLSPFFVL